MSQEQGTEGELWVQCPRHPAQQVSRCGHTVGSVKGRGRWDLGEGEGPAHRVEVNTWDRATVVSLSLPFAV